MLSIFPLPGYGVFEKTETMKKPRDVLVIDAKAVHASGYEGPNGIVVCVGSQAVKDEVPSIHQYLATLRKDLLNQGILPPPRRARDEGFRCHSGEDDR